MVIFFNDERVRNTLLVQGFVYTLRGMRKIGRDIAVVGRLYDYRIIADVNVEYVMPITQAYQLTPYVVWSGLDDSNQWLALAKRLSGADTKFHLYCVRMTRRRLYY
jgi:hypothetical protein